MRKHKLHRQRRRVVVGEHGHQGAACEFVLGLVAEHATEAEAVAGGGELGVDLVGADEWVDALGPGFAVGLEVPGAAGGGEADGGPAGEVFGVSGLAALFDEVGAGAEDVAGVAEGAGDEGAVGEVADAQGEVEAFFEQVGDAVEEGEFGAHVRVLFEPLVEQGGEVQVAEHHRGGDGEGAGGFGAVAVEAGFGGVDVGQNLAAVLQIVAAFVGEGEAAGAAVEQAHAEVLFEAGEGADDGGGGAVQFVAGGGEAALVDDGDEGAHGFEFVHGRRATPSLRKAE